MRARTPARFELRRHSAILRAMTRDESFRAAVEMHDRVAAAFADTASEVPASAWMHPRPGSEWSPAHVAAHLIAAYDVILRELRGGKGMRVRTGFFLRTIIRWTVMPRIIRTGIFPKGAKAPRETRPGDTLYPRDEAIALFRARSGEFAEAVRNAPPAKRLTHAYFGLGTVEEGVRICARHIEHHAGQMRELVGR
jgi:hypothetical protein